MPYKRKNKTVYKKVDGLKKKGKSKSVKKAKSYMRVLQGVEHGWKPTGVSTKKSAWKGGSRQGVKKVKNAKKR
ncbi:hypothetical protein LCGC14_0611290 [marine sediment metagenome]|uniref:Uncharacterized protein n=1 Tax=marine sediment metagenome TaxID=412755 RepID=A0A0F9RRW1_9ZZZZ